MRRLTGGLPTVFAAFAAASAAEAAAPLAAAAANLYFSGWPATNASIVDVTGATFGSSITFTPLAGLPNMLFNFASATSAALGNAWDASILAPDELLAAAPAATRCLA